MKFSAKDTSCTTLKNVNSVGIFMFTDRPLRGATRRRHTHTHTIHARTLTRQCKFPVTKSLIRFCVALQGEKGKGSWVVPNNVNEAVECRVPLSAEDNAGLMPPSVTNSRQLHDKSLYQKREKLIVGEKRSYSNFLSK